MFNFENMGWQAVSLLIFGLAIIACGLIAFAASVRIEITASRRLKDPDRQTVRDCFLGDWK